MIEIKYDQNMLQDIEKKLGDLKKEAPKVLKKVINDTAKQARKDLATEARKTYTIKIGGFNKAMKIKNATASRLQATIKTEGKVIGLRKFKVSPATMGAKADILKAKVLKKGSAKPLVKSGLKAFLTKFKNEHIAVAQRTSDKRYPIKTLSSNSIPKMIGNEKRVYKMVKPKIKKNLKANVQKQVEKVLNK